MPVPGEQLIHFSREQYRVVFFREPGAAGPPGCVPALPHAVGEFPVGRIKKDHYLFTLLKVLIEPAVGIVYAVHDLIDFLAMGRVFFAVKNVDDGLRLLVLALLFRCGICVCADENKK